MGAHMTLAFRNFNVEKQAEQEISKRKPSMAPKHPSTRSLLQEHLRKYPEIEEEVSRKDNKLLSLLRDIYVNSKDLLPSLPIKAIEPQQEPKEFRLPIGDHFDKNIMAIPKGKITVVEALTLLNNHKISPETWTAEKIVQEHHLELKDVIPFSNISLLLKSKSSLLKTGKQYNQSEENNKTISYVHSQASSPCFSCI